MEQHDAVDPNEEKRQEILDDHRELGDLLRRIELPEDDATARRAQVVELRFVLARHFAREEGGDGLFEIIESRAPRHSPRLKELSNEHRALLSDLAVLSSRLDESVADMDSELAGFVRELRKHEKLESKLLIDALCGGD